MEYLKLMHLSCENFYINYKRQQNENISICNSNWYLLNH